MAPAVFNKKRFLFTSTVDLKLRKKLVKCYIWSIALYGAEPWTIRAVDQKQPDSLKCGAGAGWRSVGPIMSENEEVLRRVKEQSDILHEISTRKAN